MRTKWINNAKYALIDYEFFDTLGNNLISFRFSGTQATPGIHLIAFGPGIF